MQQPTRLTELLPGFVDYMVAERHFQLTTVYLYRKGVAYFVRQLGDLPIADISLQHFISLKRETTDSRHCQRYEVFPSLCSRRAPAFRARPLVGQSSESATPGSDVPDGRRTAGLLRCNSPAQLERRAEAYRLLFSGSRRGTGRDRYADIRSAFAR